MSDYTIRPWRAEDRGELKALWRIGFGDSDEYIEGFFERFLRPGTCLVAEADGHVASAMYLLPGIMLYPFRRNVLSAGYTYALATLPAYRGRGIGAAVYKAASDAAMAQADVACVKPAEAGLYPFYEGASGAKPVSYVREARFTREELRAHPPCQAARVPVIEYARVRASLLVGWPYAELPDEFFEQLEEDGVEFFVTEHGLAAAETQDGVCRVLELLDPEHGGMAAAAAVARWCPAEEYIVRTPLFFDGPGEAAPFMLGVLREAPGYPMPNDLWWGFALE